MEALQDIDITAYTSYSTLQWHRKLFKTEGGGYLSYQDTFLWSDSETGGAPALHFLPPVYR